VAISQKLHTKLVQKLILTPSLQQAIKLLPMSTLELSELLNQEMVENPMLEEVPTEELQPVEATQEKQEEKPAQEKGDTWDDQDYEYFFGDYLDDGYRPRTPTEVKELPPIENTLSTGTSLSDHLLWQLSMQTDDPLIREIGEAIIGNLDDDGMLVATVEELAAMGPWPVEQVENALRLIQGFDPIGVAARDLQECLLLQLRHLGMGGTPAEKIVTEHMRPAAEPPGSGTGAQAWPLDRRAQTAHRVDSSSRSEAGKPPQSVAVAVRHPGRLRVKVEDQYVAVLNEEGCRSFASVPVYRRLLDKSASRNTDETRAYVKDKFRSALWLIKSVEQRQKTIHKVATSIINFSATSSITASSTSGRSCCATSPTTSACTSRP
jgi:RNA polymerase sigma-54 factor